MNWIGNNKTLTGAEVQVLTSIIDLMPEEKVEAPITLFDRTIKNANARNELVII